MIKSAVLAPYALEMLILTLVVIYISKKNKGKIVAWSFTIFCGAAMLLLAGMLFNELIAARNEWLRFDALMLILLSMYIAEVYEVFQKLPVSGNKTGT